MSDYLEISKKEWGRAADFPANKEEVYPMHKVVQEFDLYTCKTVLEYGCGGGSDTISYAKRGNIVTACDIVEKNIEATRKRVELNNLANVELVLLEDSVPLPFEDGKFDIVNSHGVLHHIRDVKPVMKELYRVTAPGGLIYAMLYSDVMWDYFTENGMIDMFMRQYDIDQFEAFCYCTDNIGVPYARPYNPEQGWELLEDAGYTIREYTYWLNDHFITYRGQKVV
jgi:SAM-dependent methyltransferase